MSFVPRPLWMLYGNNITHTKYAYTILNGHVLAFKKWFMACHNIMMKYVALRIELYCKRLKTYGFKIVVIHIFNWKPEDGRTGYQFTERDSSNNLVWNSQSSSWCWPLEGMDLRGNLICPHRWKKHPLALANIRQSFKNSRGTSCKFCTEESNQCIHIAGS